MNVSDRVRIKNIHALSERHYRLNDVEFDYRRGDGEWQTQKREVFDRGHAAALLAYNLANRTIVLTRQFRLPAFLAGHDDLLIEAAAGMLDDETPEKRIRAEAEEEIGYRLHDVRKVFEAFMSPGAVTEKLHFFVAEYEPSMRISSVSKRRSASRANVKSCSTVGRPAGRAVISTRGTPALTGTSAARSQRLVDSIVSRL